MFFAFSCILSKLSSLNIPLPVVVIALFTLSTTFVTATIADVACFDNSGEHPPPPIAFLSSAAFSLLVCSTFFAISLAVASDIVILLLYYCYIIVILFFK